MTSWFCDHAWIAGATAANVLIETDGERIATVTTDVSAPKESTRLSGMTIPGLANVHSHAFHRALRGRTHRGSADFWSWRDEMYRIAERLDPDSYHRLAGAVYVEMALAGITAVGEFHYLHHQPDGTRYADPNEMSKALTAAAAAAGIRMTLLDTCYLASGFGRSPEGVQVRFSDGHAGAWAERVSGLDVPGIVVGAAIHSVRAVPGDDAAQVAAWATGESRPLHFHLSEQPAENEASLAATGMTPAELLHQVGALGPSSTAVHATHVTAGDIALLGANHVGACICPTTERELADGIGPTNLLKDAGVRLTLGTDSHAVIDLIEEARLIELHERLAHGERGHHSAADLLDAATIDGMGALGWDSGRIAAGALADFTTVRLDSPRTAGSADPENAVIFASTAADVTDVVVGGRRVVRAGVHVAQADPGGELAAAIKAVVR